MHKYRAKPTTCIHGHKHASKREAVRCVELHLLQSAGAIVGLQVEPKFIFQIEGKPLKMRNGRKAQYRPDFTYVERGIKVAEDVKGFTVRDFPLREALFRALWPEIDLRVLK
jgi:hypothetical protein